MGVIMTPIIYFNQTNKNPLLREGFCFIVIYLAGEFSAGVAGLGTTSFSFLITIFGLGE